VRPTGGVCLVGFLGGLDPTTDFDPLMDLPSGARLTVAGAESLRLTLADVGVSS
jgi:NADPH:quinone reductase